MPIMGLPSCTACPTTSKPDLHTASDVSSCLRRTEHWSWSAWMPCNRHLSDSSVHSLGLSSAALGSGAEMLHPASAAPAALPRRKGGTSEREELPGRPLRLLDLAACLRLSERLAKGGETVGSAGSRTSQLCLCCFGLGFAESSTSQLSLCCLAGGPAWSSTSQLSLCCLLGGPAWSSTSQLCLSWR